MPTVDVTGSGLVAGEVGLMKDLPDDGEVYECFDAQGNVTLCWRNAYGVVEFEHSLGVHALGWRRLP
jgi:hypothetical protein